MSQLNLETFERANDAINRRDVEALLLEVHPEVEWHPVLLASVAGAKSVYHGHDGVREWIGDVDDSFERTVSEFSEVRDLGDRIIAFGHLRATGKESGAPVESPIFYVADFREGKAFRVWTYLDRDQALEAAGLSD